jgi:RPA family protein
MKRELAWRVFSGEYNDSTLEIKGVGEKTPSHVITPLGGYLNRLYIVGVLTDVENVSEGGEFVRAHISDPTGVFTIYSGQFQQEATDRLLNIDVPAFVSVIGKIRTYKPDDGELIVSIRPEIVREVSADVRTKWIIETCRHTKNRIDAFSEAMKMSEPNAIELRKLGYSRELCEGIISALKQYQTIDLNRYISLIKEALAYIVPSKETVQENHNEQPINDFKEGDVTIEQKTDVTEDETGENSEEIENTVFEIIKKHDSDNGVAWDLIMEKCKKSGLTEDSIEEALTSLMDKGFIFEPVLGTIKTT